MRAAQPQIARLGDGNRRQRRHGILVPGVVQKEVIDLLRIKPRQGQIDVRPLDVPQLQRQPFVIPIGPGS